MSAQPACSLAALERALAKAGDRESKAVLRQTRRQRVRLTKNPHN